MEDSLLNNNDNDETLILQRSKTVVLSHPENNYLEKEIYTTIDQRLFLIRSLLKEHIEKISKMYQSMKDNILNHLTNLTTLRASFSHNQKKNQLEDIMTELKSFFKIEEIIRIGMDLSLCNFEEFISSVDFKNYNQNDSKVYIKKAILNEAFLQKDLNFADYNITFDNKQINEGIQDLLVSCANKHNITYTIRDNAHQEKDFKILNDNCDSLTHLNFINITYMQEYFHSNTKTFTKLKVLQFKECSFDSLAQLSKNINSKTNKNFPSLTSLIYQDTYITLETINNNLLPPLCIKGIMPPIQVLKLDKANITKNELTGIFKSLILNANLIKTLKVLSFTHNSIKSFNYPQLLDDISPSQKIKFESLEELNMSNNQLYLFVLGYQFFPNIQLINLIDNAFANKNELQFPLKKNILLLSNRNMFLANQLNMKKYTKNLMTVLPSFTYPIEYMSLSGLFTKFTANGILDIPLNCDTLLHLQDLDLSYCGLNTGLLIQFICNNNRMPKLKCLNLRYNFITIDFFEQYNVKQNNTDLKRFNYLEKIDMSNNAIINKDFKHVFEFISLHKEFKNLNLVLNPFGREYTIEKKRIDSAKINKDIETVHNNYPFYAVDKALLESKKEGTIMSFNEMITKIYDINSPLNNRKIYIDFSTDSRVIMSSKLEKKDCLLLVKPKSK